MLQQQNLSQFNRYLINNKQLLQQKFIQYFPEKNITISKFNHNSLIDYIYDIFSFDKYKKNKTLHKKIYDSLDINVKNYISQNNNKAKQKFTAQFAVQILKYCISHNDLFSVQYDVDKKTNNTSSDQSKVNVALYDKNIENKKLNGKQQNSALKYQNKIMKKQNVTSNNQKINSQQNIKQEQQILENQKQQDKQQIKGSLLPKTDSQGNASNQNQFDQSPQKNQSNYPTDLIRKNAKVAYLSFCKNQMQLGGNKTFDRLSQQATTMTIGKLLVYAKAYNIIQPPITKQILIQKFKRISEGKRTIDFQQFFLLLNMLYNLDSSIYIKLQLLDSNINKKLKFVKYPFYTQDQNPRQLIAKRSFSNKLTSHSGKTHEQLKKDIQLRKIINSPLRNSVQGQLKRQLNQQLNKKVSRLIRPKDLNSSNKSTDLSIELSFIDKIVKPDPTDEKYLKQYDMQILKRYQSGMPGALINNRKQSIIKNLQKRVQQMKIFDKINNK